MLVVWWFFEAVALPFSCNFLSCLSYKFGTWYAILIILWFLYSNYIWVSKFTRAQVYTTCRYMLSCWLGNRVRVPKIPLSLLPSSPRRVQPRLCGQPNKGSCAAVASHQARVAARIYPPKGEESAARLCRTRMFFDSQHSSGSRSTTARSRGIVDLVSIGAP
jgi:hypothetical protein